MGMEPTTGFGLVGSKTYQVTHLVGRTKILYPDLWVANNTGAASGLGYDFVAGERRTGRQYTGWDSWPPVCAALCCTWRRRWRTRMRR